MSWFGDMKTEEKSSKREKEKESLLTEIEGLRKEKRAAKEELEELKFKKRLEQEEIVHLQKINEAKMKQEMEEFKLKTTKEKEEEMLKFQQTQMTAINNLIQQQSDKILFMNAQLHEKMENRFNTELGNLKEIYQALMQRIPNVTMAITKKM